MSRHMRREYGEQPISREQAQEYAADSDRVNEAAREEAHQCFRGNRSGRMGRGEMQERGMSRENSELVAHEYGNGESVDEQELTNAIATGDARTDGNGDFRDSSGNFQAEGAGTEESANNDEYIGTDTPVTTGAVEEPVVETATDVDGTLIGGAVTRTGSQVVSIVHPSFRTTTFVGLDCTLASLPLAQVFDDTQFTAPVAEGVSGGEVRLGQRA